MKIDIRKYDYSNHNVNIEIRHELKLDKPPIITTQSTPFGDKNIMKIESQLNISYSPDLGYMIFNGTIDYVNDTVVIAKDDWDSSQKDVIKVKNECANAVLQNILSIAMLLSNRVNLPPVLQIPLVNFDKNNKKRELNYIG